MEPKGSPWRQINGSPLSLIIANFFMDDFEKKEIEQVKTETCMLVPICRRHFHHLSPWPRKADSVSEPPQWISHEYLVQREKRRPPSIFGYWHLQETRQLPRSQSLLEAHTYQSLSTPGFVSPLSKNNQSWLPWNTDPKLFVTRVPALKNWNKVTKCIVFNVACKTTFTVWANLQYPAAL